MSETKPPATRDAIIARYEEKLAQHRSSVERCDRRWSSVGYLRGGLFLSALVPFFLAINKVAGLGWGWMYLSVALLLGFFVVAFIHEGMQFELRRASLLVKIYRESVARCRRDWEQIQVPEVELERSEIPRSTDLDLFTASSIFKLLGITRTPLGTAILKEWILTGAESNEVKQRQSAVAELKDEIDWRESFQLTCEQLSVGRSGPSQFVSWANSENWFAGRSWMLWLARLTSAASIVSLFCLLLVPSIPSTISLTVLVAAMVINFVTAVLMAGKIHEIFNQVSSQTNEANYYVTLFERILKFDAKSERLKSLQQQIQSSNSDGPNAIAQLGRYVGLANMRRNGVLFIVYITCQFLFLWDVHALDLLERWKSKNGSQVQNWFRSLGQWEALCALAKLAGDEPGWVFSDVYTPQTVDQPLVQGTEMGHPLLDDSRVTASVEVGPPGTVLLVTGSNMSGKSTLLRSIGANVVLGQMGSVVCARQFRQPTMQIETSMRIADSLADGVSFFMAELKRLKQVVDTAETLSQDPSGKQMLFLLDEILQGTNSRERQIAVSRVVKRLIDRRAIGAISTHDLDLAKTDELSTACQPVYFSEQFEEIEGKKVMTFDYQMKHGIAETTNALKLLELVGL